MKWTKQEVEKLKKIRNVPLKKQVKIMNRTLPSIIEKRFFSKIKKDKLPEKFIKVVKNEQRTDRNFINTVKKPH